MNVTRQFLYVIIDAERERQHTLKASGRFRYTLDDPQIPHATALAAVTEECGEAAREVLALSGDVFNEDLRDHRARLQKEVVQIAALCVAWLEKILNEQNSL